MHNRSEEIYTSNQSAWGILFAHVQDS